MIGACSWHFRRAISFMICTLLSWILLHVISFLRWLLLFSYLFFSFFTELLFSLFVGIFIFKFFSVVMVLWIIIFWWLITVIVAFFIILACFVIINNLQILKVVIHSAETVTVLILVLILAFHVVVNGSNFCFIILDTVSKDLIKPSWVGFYRYSSCFKCHLTSITVDRHAAWLGVNFLHLDKFWFLLLRRIKVSMLNTWAIIRCKYVFLWHLAVCIVMAAHFGGPHDNFCTISVLLQ